MSGVGTAMSDSSINPFLYDEEYVHILSGEEEALFAWITVNYLKKYFEDRFVLPSHFSITLEKYIDICVEKK